MRRDKPLSPFVSSSTVTVKLLVPTILAIGALLFVAGSVEAAPVYSQITPAEPGSAFSSQDISTGPIVADNFSLGGPGPITVRSLRLIGGCCGETTPPPPTDNFRVVFLEDSGGVPGQPIPGGDFLIGPATRRTTKESNLLNGVFVPIEYAINFEEGFTLNPGIEYWMSIMNNLGPGQGWVWARANGVLDDQTAVTFSNFANSSWITATNGGMWFELDDQNVPEPNELVLILTALSVIALRRRSHCFLKPSGIAVLVSAMSFASSASAAPIYSQVTPSEPIGAFSSRDTIGGQRIADNFLLDGPDPITIRSIRFLGGDTTTPSLPDDFRVVFLEDTEGMPGVPVAGGDFAIGSAALRAATGGQLLNGVTVPYEYVINLPGGILLSPETEYWVSILNARELGNGWVWARANGLLDNQTAAKFDDIDSGTWDVFVNGGMWFELGDQEIPEPTTFVLSLSGIAYFALIRRQRRFSIQRLSSFFSLHF